MKDSIKRPVFSYPSGEQAMRNTADYLRRLDIFLTELMSVGKINVTTINAAALPASGYGLRDGDFFLEGDTVKAVLPDTGYAGSYGMTISVGSVTVEV